MTGEGTDTNLDFNYSIKQYTENITFPTWGNQTYQLVGFKLVLRRHYFKYIIYYYGPSMIFVTASWMSFMIPPEVVPGRMALLITLLLVLVNLFGTVIETQPPTQYPTYLDIWMLACILFVYAALDTYAYLLLQLKLKRQYPQIKKVKPLADESSEENISEILAQNLGTSWDLDMWCLILFPLAFLVFNLVYWPAITI